MLALTTPLMNIDPAGDWCLFLVRNWGQGHCYSRSGSGPWRKYYRYATYRYEFIYPSSGWFTSQLRECVWEDGRCSGPGTWSVAPYTYAICGNAVLQARSINGNDYQYDGWVNVSDSSKFMCTYWNADEISGFISSGGYKKGDKVSLLDYLKYRNIDYNNVTGWGGVPSVGEAEPVYCSRGDYPNGFSVKRSRTYLICTKK